MIHIPKANFFTPIFTILSMISIGLIESNIQCMELDTTTIKPNLENIYNNIKAAYAKQFDDFKISATPNVNEIFATKEMRTDIDTLKKLTKSLPTLVSGAQLKDEAQNLHSIALGIINSMQVIDGNLQTYFDELPNNKEYKKIIDTTLTRVRSEFTEQ